MNRLALFILANLALAYASSGQYYSKLFSAGLDINQPIVNREFINAVSTKGFKFNYAEFINDNLVIGAEAGLAEYHDYIPPQVYTQDNLTFIYTDIFSYVYSYSLNFSGKYFFIPDKIVMPYAGLGVGVAHNQFTMYYNAYTQQDKRWGALVRPQGGVIIRAGKDANWGLLADVHLDYATTKSKDTDYNKGFATTGFQLGVVFLKR